METILTLAATRELELGQSYERNAVYAGKGSDLKDWAPIYLSHDLTDTEFGQLLNMTDQLLKGWAASGSKNYDIFPYPEPKKYPFDAGVRKTLQTDVLTYNWNTSGFGYTIPFDGHEVFALQRTGALPVSFIPEGVSERTETNNISTVQNAEEVYWNFFASSRDANLHRAVEYTALYQIFKRFPVDATRIEPLSPEYSGRNSAVEDIVSNVIAGIQSDEFIESLRVSNGGVQVRSGK